MNKKFTIKIKNIKEFTQVHHVLRDHGFPSMINILNQYKGDRYNLPMIIHFDTKKKLVRHQGSGTVKDIENFLIENNQSEWLDILIPIEVFLEPEKHPEFYL